jgi:formylmethanofuran dehydrogenase subunit B
MDHVPIAKKIVNHKGILSDEEILTRILKEVKEIKAKKTNKTAKKTEA